MAEAEQGTAPIAIVLASMMGWIRNWMGVENMAYLMHDDPDVYADMVDTLAELTCWSIDQVLPRMKTRPVLGVGWEDICFRSGPLVNPRFFERYVAHGYEKMGQKLESYGIDLMAIDCDGLIEPLLGPWLEVRVSVHYPVEIGVWGADPIALRKRFGRRLRMVGGFNKFALEQGPAAIDAEIERRLPLVGDGGYIIMPDHHITPGVSLENYQYYIGRLHQLSEEGLL
jgi:uroporphyrinogen decarboxylase